MSQSNGAAGNSAMSSRAAGGRSGNGKPHERGQVLGEIEELGSYVFKFGTNDQADAFLRAIEHIGDYMSRVKESKEMKNLVNLVDKYNK